MRFDAGQRGRHGEAKILVGAEIGVAQRAVQRRGEQRPRHLDRHAAAGAVFAAGPAGVDQPAIDTVLGDQITQQIAIDRRVARQEWRAEAGREFRLRLLAQAALGARHLRGIAGQEVVHRLRRRQFRDRRHHAERIRRQHHQVLRMRRAAGARGVGDEFERIGGAGVFGFRAVVEIRFSGAFVEHHVFQHRAEALAGGIDFGLGFLRQLDAFGVAAALKVEDAIRAPAVLVVTDQRALRVGRQRGLAGAGQAEEHRGVAVGPDIGRAVHRHHALFGQVIIQRGENRLFHLAGILGAADQDDLAGEVDRDHVLRTHAVAFGIGLEARQIDDRQFRHEVLKLRRLGADQERADEQRMPGELGIDAGRDPKTWIGAAMEILRKQRHAFGMLEKVGVERFELF